MYAHPKRRLAGSFEGHWLTGCWLSAHFTEADLRRCFQGHQPENAAAKGNQITNRQWADDGPAGFCWLLAPWRSSIWHAVFPLWQLGTGSTGEAQRGRGRAQRGEDGGPRGPEDEALRGKTHLQVSCVLWSSSSVFPVLLTS
jgi:hypothetical protein